MALTTLMTIPVNTHVNGELSCRSLAVPNSTIDNLAVSPSADIEATKSIQQRHKNYSQASAATATAARLVLSTVYGDTGTIVAFRAGTVTPCTGNATITVDLYVNGSTVLNAVITLDNANTAYQLEAATILTDTLVENDVMEIVVAVNAGTGVLGLGLFVELLTHEDPA
mgnify:CR=1 FL=1